jgi:bifunctional DNA-binding transcriptional regulator/antitoxin component of YhaV-PrlF toxin-antitoxin module
MTETVSLSADGQIVLPQTIRLTLSSLAEKRFIVYSDGDNILLKSVKHKIPEFKKLMKQTQELATEAGLTEDDIVESIKAVRQKNHENRY